MDAVSAFLNADIESNIYMEQPEGCHGSGPNGTRLVCHLKKGLYGIREAPKAWNNLLTSWPVSYGFAQSIVDPKIFTILYEQLLYILAVYVDDSILVGKIGKFILNFKASLSERFEIEELGPTTWLLGCIIERNKKRGLLRLG